MVFGELDLTQQQWKGLSLAPSIITGSRPGGDAPIRKQKIRARPHTCRAGDRAFAVGRSAIVELQVMVMCTTDCSHVQLLAKRTRIK